MHHYIRIVPTTTLLPTLLSSDETMSAPLKGHMRPLSTYCYTTPDFDMPRNIYEFAHLPLLNVLYELNRLRLLGGRTDKPNSHCANEDVHLFGKSPHPTSPKF